jgi:hypothetical protein
VPRLSMFFLPCYIEGETSVINNLHYRDKILFFLFFFRSTEAPPFPLDRFPSVKDLCFATIRKFRPIGLKSDRQDLSAGAQLRPVETQYQDEFYRAYYTLLNHIYLSS